MTSARPVFGDFLDIAHRQLDRSSSDAQVRGGEDLGEACRSLRRLVVVLERHAGDLLVPRKMGPDAGRDQSAWDQVPASACRALNHAAAVLSQSQVRTNPGATGAARSLAGDFDAVARSLTAGRDLVHTHRASTATGTSEDRTEWGPVIASPPVARARLAEMAALAERIAARGRRAALASGWRGSPETRRRLTVACDWLMTFEAAVRAASDQEPVPAKDRELLRAIPADTLPLQRTPAGGSIRDLCAQISANAERARRAAWQSVPDAAWSPETTITSLRRVAEASAVTSRNCEIVLGSLADGTEPPLPDRMRDILSRAAVAAERARAGWLQAAHSLDNITTDTSGSMSWPAQEASEIALWTGRLANADSDWVPSAMAAGAPTTSWDLRKAERGRDGICAVVAAVHESSHALSSLARADYERIRRAASSGRILTPARSNPRSVQAQHLFVPAPSERIGVVLAEYHDAQLASDQAAAAVGEVAEAVEAPSRFLTAAAAARTHSASAVRSHRPEPPCEPAVPSIPASAAPPGPLLRILEDLKVTNPHLLGRAALLDRASEQLVIDAAEQQDGRQEATRSAEDLRMHLGDVVGTRQADGNGRPRAGGRGPAAHRDAPQREP